jgi:hypothetical protein
MGPFSGKHVKCKSIFLLLPRAIRAAEQSENFAIVTLTAGSGGLATNSLVPGGTLLSGLGTDPMP